MIGLALSLAWRDGLDMIRLAALILLLPGLARAEQVLVFAPASLGGTLDLVAEAFEAETGHDVVISYAGTSTLAFQIRHGAPADVFISASIDWMDMVEEDGHLLPGTRRDILSNSLVVVSTDVLPLELSRLPERLGDGRLAMALTDAVPAGQYGREALEALELWDAVSLQVVETDNVRAALRLVALGEAALGIVYRTDAMAEEGVSIVATFPPETHRSILYPAARLTKTDAARDFLAFLDSEPARVIFSADGFGRPDEPAE